MQKTGPTAIYLPAGRRKPVLKKIESYNSTSNALFNRLLHVVMASFSNDGYYKVCFADALISHTFPYQFLLRGTLCSSVEFVGSRDIAAEHL